MAMSSRSATRGRGACSTDPSTSRRRRRTICPPSTSCSSSRATAIPSPRNPSTLGGGEADKHLIYEGLVARGRGRRAVAARATIRGGDLVLSVWHPELVALRASLGLPRHPMQIVATLHGIDLERGLMFNVPELRVTVITVARGAEAMRHGLAARPWITPIVMDDAHDLAGAFRQLRRLGVRRAVVHRRPDARRAADRCGADSGPVSDHVGAVRRRTEHAVLRGAARGRRLIARKHGTGADRGVVFEHLKVQGTVGRFEPER